MSRFGIGLGLIAVVVALLALWQLRSLVLVVFAAILFAVLFDAAARTLRRVAPVGQIPAVIVSTVVLLVLFLGLVALLGQQTLAEVSELTDRIPEAVEKLEHWIDLGRIEDWIAGRLQSTAGTASVLSGISGMTSILIGFVTGLLLALAGGFFIAMSPHSYRDGAVRLAPEGQRAKVRAVMDCTGAALRAWLLGQLVAMVAVGAMTAVGLWLLGVSTPIGLGVIAGLLEFIPYVGPVASAAPAVTVAFVDSPTTALWVTLLYVGIQQVEGALLIPLIQRQAVDLPPAVTVFSVVGFGVLFGPAGVLLAAPLTVVAFVVVRQVWIPFVEGGADAEAGTPGTADPVER